MKLLFRFTFFLVLVVSLWRCNAKPYHAITTGKYELLDSTYNSSSEELEQLIAPYNDGLASKMARVLNTSDQAMVKNRPEGLLSNFCADLIFEEVTELKGFEADFCLLNHGGLRSALPQGEITVEDIFQLMPFDNEAVVLELSGENVLKIASYFSTSGGEPISQATVDLSESTIKIKGEFVDINATYKVITSDYLANGGDKMTFFNAPISVKKTGLKIRDLIIEYIEEEFQEGNTLKSTLDGRIY